MYFSMKNTLKITVITLLNRPEPLLCKSIMKRKRGERERERVVAYFHLHDRLLFLFLFHLDFLLLKFLEVILYYFCFKN